jgi:hypothetical protein
MVRLSALMGHQFIVLLDLEHYLSFHLKTF